MPKLLTARHRRRTTRVGPLSNIRREPEGWTVAVIRRSEHFSDYFGDAVWGGRAKALVAAQHFRDRLLLRIEPDTRVRPSEQDGRGGGQPRTSRRRWSRLRALRRLLAGSAAGAEEAPLPGRAVRQGAGARPRDRRARDGCGAAPCPATRPPTRGSQTRLQKAPPMPRPVKDPRSRKGISMARRRPRHLKGAKPGIKRARQARW